MKAAKQGKMQAQYQVGRMLELGQGTARNLEEARYWYEKAAAQGDTDSARRLQSLGQ
jgi:TPR repeat protein